MLVLILAVITSIFVAVTIKFFERFNVNSFQAIVVNYIVCIIFGIIAYKGKINFHSIPSQQWFYLAILLGFGFLTLFTVFALSTAKIGIALSTVSSKMSVIFPVYFGILLYDDEINIYKIIGILFTLLSFYFILKKDKNIPFRKLYFYFPLILFIGNGYNDTLQTYCQRVFKMDNNMILLFMVVIYITALLTGILIFTYKKITHPASYFVHRNSVIGGIILGVFNFATTFFFLKSVGLYQSTFVFPVFNVSIVSLTALIGFFFFREKLRPLNWLGIALAIIAIITIAIG